MRVPERGLRWAVIAAAIIRTTIGSASMKVGAQQGQWASQDIGSPAIAGSASSTPSGFTVTAGGADISGTSDQFHFVYQYVSGDVDVRARIDSITNASSASKAGVMVRASLAPDAAHGSAFVSAANGTAFQRRPQDGALSTSTDGVFVAAPEWVRLVRRGNTVSAYTSPDGTAWTLIGSDTIQLPGAVYVGLAATSANVSAATTASVSQIGVSLVGLPAGQQDADIGSPAIAGWAAYANGTYQIHAGGSDIWGTSDQFHYVYQPVNGDVDIAVRIASVSRAHRWSKAGVMIRETLSPGAAHAFALISAAKGIAFQRRPVAGGGSVSTTGTNSVPPGWLRLKRAGSLITAYSSTDGQNWTVIGSDAIPMADSVFVGIAATSHSQSTATDVVADSFTVTESGIVNQPPTVSITSPASGATFTAPASIAITASASDPENQLTKVELYSSTTLLGTDTAAPYSFAWSSVLEGTYSLTAVAYDGGGLTASSPAVVIVVGPPPTAVPTGVMFTASPDHATVASYRLDVFAAGVDPATAVPIATMDAGKPAPDANNEITVSAPSFFSALAPGSYQLTVSAVNAAGIGRSTPIAFTR